LSNRNSHQNFNNTPLYKAYGINNPEIRGLENSIRSGLENKSSYVFILTNYSNSHSNGSIPNRENNPLKIKKK